MGFLNLVKDELHKGISKIQIIVSTNNEGSFTIKDNVITSTFQMSQVVSKEVVGCWQKVEKILNLRPDMEQRAIANVNKELSSTGKGSIKIPIEIDWNHLTQTSKFKSSSSFVDMINFTYKECKKVILGQGGLSDCFPETIKELNSLKKIIFKIDVNNQVVKKVGIYTPNYQTSQSDDSLVIFSNYSNSQTVGCWSIVEFELTPSLAKMKEEKETMRLKQEEEERKRIREENERKEKERKEKEKKDKEEREKKAKEEKEKMEKLKIEKRRKRKAKKRR